MLWPVLRMTAGAFLMATMRTTDTRGQWCRPVLCLLRGMHVDKDAQGDVEVWWKEEQEDNRAGVQIG